MQTQMLQMQDAVPIKVARWEPQGPPMGVVQLLHGFGEHLQLYESLAEQLTRQGYACVTHDQRGHGEMPGLDERQCHRRFGIAPNYETFLSDIDTVRSHIDGWHPQLPVFLYGHSMGGNIALSYLLRRTQQRHQKVVLETPWLRLHEQEKQSPPMVRVAARVLGGISPKIVYPTKLNIDAISRDTQYVAQLRRDPLFHNRLSFRLITQIMDAGEAALANAQRLTLPTLLLCAGQDKIVCPQAIREFAAKAGPNVVLEEYPEGYHALHNDTNQSQVIDRVVSFLEG